MGDNRDELSELNGVESMYEYGGALEVRFTQDHREETIASIMTWARKEGRTITAFEKSTPSTSKRVMILAEDPDGELTSWRDKAIQGDEISGVET